MSDDPVQPLVRFDQPKLSGKPRPNSANYNTRAHRATIEKLGAELSRKLG